MTTPVTQTTAKRAAASTQGAQGARGPQGPPGPSGGSSAPQYARRTQRAAQQFTRPDFRNYQGIILAEFIAAELLVAATPIASNRQTPGLSPYVPRDVTKLLAIGAVYFLLELTAVLGSGWGKFGAGFGGLILLVVGMNEAANIVADLDAFAGFTQKVNNVKDTLAGGGGGSRPVG